MTVSTRTISAMRLSLWYVGSISFEFNLKSELVNRVDDGLQISSAEARMHR